MPGKFNYSADPDCFDELYGHHVPGVGERLSEAGRAFEFMVIIFRGPVSPAPPRIGDRFVNENARRSEALIKGCCEDDRFERRTRLPFCIEDPVIIAFYIIIAANHCPDEPGVLINRDKGSFCFRFLLEPQLNVAAEDLLYPNLHDVARSLRASLVPGEPIMLRISKEGREEGQGVGYLPDGTMVVVNGARHLVGHEVEARVQSTIQTGSGLMVFADLRDQDADTGVISRA